MLKNTTDLQDTYKICKRCISGKINNYFVKIPSKL